MLLLIQSTRTHQVEPTKLMRVLSVAMKNTLSAKSQTQSACHLSFLLASLCICDNVSLCFSLLLIDSCLAFQQQAMCSVFILLSLSNLAFLLYELSAVCSTTCCACRLAEIQSNRSLPVCLTRSRVVVEHCLL